MAEMTRRERVMASAMGKSADRLPFFHWWRHSQIGWAERECRNRGMGMNWFRPPHAQQVHDVQVAERSATVSGRSVIRRTYTTPVGSVYEDEYRYPGTGQWHGSRSWQDVSPWTLSRLIKGPEDYAVVQYMVEHTEYVADYMPIEQAMDWLGEDGVVVAALPASPMQMLLIHWIGSEGGRAFYHLADYPELVNDLYQALSVSRESLYQIAARSPAPIVVWGENVDGQLVSPALFERYLMPEYEKQAEAVRAKGKLLAIHMDGSLASLKQLIARSPIDIIEAFLPPPMGNLALGEALAAWPDKAIWLGFPGGIYELGHEATRDYAIALLREAGTGERLAIAMSTENIVSNANLIALTSVLERARLPLTPESLDAVAPTGQGSP